MKKKIASPDILQQIPKVSMSLSGKTEREALKKNGMKIILQLKERETTLSLEGHRELSAHVGGEDRRMAKKPH